MDKRLVKLLLSGKIGGGVIYTYSTPTTKLYTKKLRVLLQQG